MINLVISIIIAIIALVFLYLPVRDAYEFWGDNSDKTLSISTAILALIIAMGTIFNWISKSWKLLHNLRMCTIKMGFKEKKIVITLINKGTETLLLKKLEWKYRSKMKRWWSYKGKWIYCKDESNTLPFLLESTERKTFEITMQPILLRTLETSNRLESLIIWINESRWFNNYYVDPEYYYDIINSPNKIPAKYNERIKSLNIKEHNDRLVKIFETTEILLDYCEQFKKKCEKTCLHFVKHEYDNEYDHKSHSILLYPACKHKKRIKGIDGFKNVVHTNDSKGVFIIKQHTKTIPTENTTIKKREQNHESN